MSLAVDPGIAEVMWHGTTTPRLRAHHDYGTPVCPTRVAPYVTGSSSHQVCRDDGCLGVMHEVYARTVSRLAQSTSQQAITSPMAYARRIVASQVADLERSRRVARGLPAKPTRADGIAGRINAALLASSGDDRGAWLLVLFRMMRGYVCRDGHRSADWPVDMWAIEKTRHDGHLRLIGSTGARAEIARDIAAVLAESERVAGSGWVNDSILHPLLTVRVPWGDVVERSVAATEPSVEDHVLAGQVRSRYAVLTARGVGPQAAWLRAVRDTTGQDPVGDVWSVLDDLTGLPGRRGYRAGGTVASSLSGSSAHAHPMP